MRKKHNLLIGKSAQSEEHQDRDPFPFPHWHKNGTATSEAINLVTGLPKTVTVSSEETEEALVCLIKFRDCGSGTLVLEKMPRLSR